MLLSAALATVFNLHIDVINLLKLGYDRLHLGSIRLFQLLRRLKKNPSTVHPRIYTSNMNGVLLFKTPPLSAF